MLSENWGVLYVLMDHGDMDAASEILDSFADKVYDASGTMYYRTLSRFYQETNQLQLAIKAYVDGMAKYRWNDYDMVHNEKYLARLYERVGDTVQSQIHYKKYGKLSNKLFNDFRDHSIKVSNKAYANEKLIVENQRMTFIIHIVAIIVVSLSVIAFLVVKRIIDHKQKEKNEAELALNKLTIEMTKKIYDAEEHVSELEKEFDEIKLAAKDLLHDKLLSVNDKLDMNYVRQLVNIAYNGFCSRVMACDVLGDKEKEYCLLYRMGLGPKVIAFQTGVSLSRAYSRKGEIITKLYENKVIESRLDDDFDAVLDIFGKKD